MLKITKLYLQRGSKELLNQTDLYIKPNDKVGIIGENGCGKSSFFSLLLGKIECTAGEIEFTKQIRLAHLSQEIEETDKPAIEFVIDGDESYRQLEQEINLAEIDKDGLKLAELHTQMQFIDGYNIQNRAAVILYGLGFTAKEFSAPVHSFSGGWRMRINLAKTLMSRADMYLLDEPTNHLDLETIVWLEKWLKSLKATFLMISHDREFLDNICDHIAHFDNKTIKYYSGNYSSFEKQRAEQLALQQASYEKQQKRRAHLQSFVDRFRYKATKAKQAQSRLKALEKMALVSPAHADSPFSFVFHTPKKLPTPLIRLDNVSIGYELPILSKVNLTINPGDRFGILGPNGAGKSTLIKLLSQNLQPLAGEVFYHNDLKLGYFTQHQSEYLDYDASPLLHLQRLDNTISEQNARNFLGQFNFHGDMALEAIKNFSGGEKARLALALLIWQQPNLLLLDEPTNHFDLNMRHALTLALQDFAGAIILISHDRHLIKTTMDELLLVHNGKIQKFNHDLDQYPACLEENEVKKEIAPKSFATKKQIRQEAAKNRDAAKEHIKRIKIIETSMHRCQKELDNLHVKLEDMSLYAPEKKSELTTLLQLQAQLNKQLTELEDEWIIVQEKL